MTARSVFLLVVTALSSVSVLAQQPVPELPRAYVDSSYRAPTGARIVVRRGDDLQAAFDAAKPGETIVLAAGATFTGNFMLPPKTGNGWIYIQSSALDRMAKEGHRTSPAEAAHMPKIMSTNGLAAISVLPGASNYRLVGLEITPAKGAPRLYQLVNIDYVVSQVGAQLRNLGKRVAPELLKEDEFPKNIVIDRCYIHGSDTQDVREGVVVNGIDVAVVDSYISDIHDGTMDSQAILGYRSPGPIKIVNNFLSATTENIMFGGAGAPNNAYIPSDIEIRGNYLFKPLAWRQPGITLPIVSKGPYVPPRWVVKNCLEFKNAQRVLVTGNMMENNWVSGQPGYSVLMTPRASDSGNGALVDDVTVEGNILKNVDAGFNTLERDYLCSAEKGHPKCTNQGESKRIKIANNLVLMNPENSTIHHVGFSVAVDLTDTVFEHNTLLMSDQSKCFASLYFNAPPKATWPFPHSGTNNLWVLDNVLCRQPSGDFGRMGVEGLSVYMGAPPPLQQRFSGNVMLVSSGDVAHDHPPKNALPTKISFADPAAGNYQLVSPKFNQTTDEQSPGVDMTALAPALQATAGSPGPVETPAAPPRATLPPVQPEANPAPQ